MCTTDHAATAAPPHLDEVAQGVFAYVQPDGSWWVNNAGLVVGDDAALLVDTCATADRTRALLAAVEGAAGGRPLRFALNTHLHGDHTYGNLLLPEATTLIGHVNMRAGLAADPFIHQVPPFWSKPLDWGVSAKRLPEVTFSDALRLHVGGRDVHIDYIGHPAHTTGDAVAWLPQERVLFAGDLVFHQVTPLIFMGSLAGARAALDTLAAYEPEVIVPGHGPVLRGAGEIAGALGAIRAYYDLVAERAEAGLAAGLTPLECAQATDLGEAAGLPDAERIVLNLHRAYADAQGHELDLVAAFRDALAYNGGPLPTHV